MLKLNVKSDIRKNITPITGTLTALLIGAAVAACSPSPTGGTVQGTVVVEDTFEQTSQVTFKWSPWSSHVYLIKSDKTDQLYVALSANLESDPLNVGDRGEFELDVSFNKGTRSYYEAGRLVEQEATLHKLLGYNLQ